MHYHYQISIGSRFRGQEGKWIPAYSYQYKHKTNNSQLWLVYYLRSRCTPQMTWMIPVLINPQSVNSLPPPQTLSKRKAKNKDNDYEWKTPGKVIIFDKFTKVQQVYNVCNMLNIPNSKKTLKMKGLGIVPAVLSWTWQESLPSLRSNIAPAVG